MKKKILLLSAVLLGIGSLMAQPTSFSEPRVFIKSSQSLMAPVWSPDGSKLAVTGDNFVGIWVANADGTSLQQVSDAVGAGYKMTWTDAQNITSTPYVMDGMRRMTRIESVNVETGKISEVAAATRDFKRSKATNATSVLKTMVDNPVEATQMIASLNKFEGKMVLNPALSPDGKKIAFQVVSNGCFVCNVDGTELVALGKGAYPSWMPDSKHIMVSRYTDNGHQFTSADIYCVNVENGDAINITPNSDAIPITLAVSPDGSKVAFDNDADGCIYVIDLK